MDNVPPPEPQISEEDYSTSRSILRLIVGGVIGGISTLAEELRVWEEEHPQETIPIDATAAEVDQLTPTDIRHATVGLIFNSYERIHRIAAKAGRGAEGLARVGLAPIKVITDNVSVTRVTNRLDALAERGRQELEGWIRTGRYEDNRSRAMAGDIFNEVVGEVVQQLSYNPQINILIKGQLELLSKEPDNPQVDELVRKLASNYLNYLEGHPEELHALIQGQGNQYIDYLNDNPDDVQNLIQGQSLSLATEIRDQIRERLVTADSTLELFVRRFFRRPWRDQLPGPPIEVRVRAERAILPGDFKRLEGRSNQEINADDSK